MKTISWNADGKAERAENAGHFGAAEAAGLAHGHYRELNKEAVEWAERRIEDHTARLHEIIKERASNGMRTAYWRNFLNDYGGYVQDDGSRFEGVGHDKTYIFDTYILPGVMKRLKAEGFVVERSIEHAFGRSSEVVEISW